MTTLKKRSYLTIDDSPTNQTDELTDWLAREDIPAVIFAIGGAYKDMHLECEGMEQNPGAIERAIEKGFLIANHTYSHRRASELSLKTIFEEIERTEAMIESLYKKTGKNRSHKMIRFPHLDRGCGGHIVDYMAARAMGYDLEPLFLKGLNIKLAPPTEEQLEKKAAVQEYLAREGYSTKGFLGVTFDWYANTEMAAARDSLYTFSTSDWMLNPDFEPYRKDWEYQSVEALKKKIDDDEYLHSDQSVNIVLAHDHNNMFKVTSGLVAHMKKSGIEFIPVV
jgi:peptidoglycan/xylan/chitin deacetylase (PgdA/CDA1 family)